MFLNEKEGAFIGKFLKSIDKYDADEMTLIWNGEALITARFDTCFEDENEYEETDIRYEEFTTLFLKLFVSLAIHPFL